MGKKTMVFAFILSIALALGAAERVGITLLDSFVDQFRQLAVSGAGGYEPVNKSLQDSMAKARKALAENQIDRHFYQRFTRMLEITKLVIITKDYDPERILGPLMNREIFRFILEVTGMEPAQAGKGGIGEIAGALSEEILNLYMVVDCQGKKEEMRKKFENWGSPKKES